MQEECYWLMNKDRELLRFAIQRGVLGSVQLEEKERRAKPQELPFGFESIQVWAEHRQAPKHREHIAELMRQCGCSEVDGFIRITHALSLNDTFWVRAEGSPLTWKDVSLYRNAFDDTIARIAFEGGMYGAHFSSTSPEFETSGSFAKCWVREPGGTIYLLKRGSSGARNAGLEPYSETYTSQVARRICRSSVPYTTVRFRGQLASKCPLFTSEQEGFVPIHRCIAGSMTLAKVMEYMSGHGAEEDFRRMLVLDALVLNTDRHAGNYGMLFDNDTMEIRGMAPVFDHNQALLPYAQEEEFAHLEEYLAGRPTRIGNDFNEIAYEALTPGIRADLINLKGFRFDREQEYGLPKERLVILENVIDRQIDHILKRKLLYMPAEVETKKKKGRGAKE